MPETIKTTCTRDCPDACGIVCTVEDDVITRHVGDPDHPATQGFLCYKGNTYLQRFNDERRVLHPMRKVNGEWKQVGWDEALDLAAEQLEKHRDEFGPLSVLYCQYSGSLSVLKIVFPRMFWGLFGGATIRKGGLSSEAGRAGMALDFGAEVSSDPSDIMNSRSIIVWGKNPASTNVHYMPFIREAKKRGAKLYVIDPIFTKTAREAHQFIQVRPGADGLLAIAIARIIRDTDRVDGGFIDSKTANYPEYCQLLDSYSVEECARAADVSMETVRHLADVFTGRKPVNVLHGLGTNYWKWGGENWRLIDALAAISGNIGIPGGGANYAVNGHAAYDFSFLSDYRAKEHRTFLLPNLCNSINGLTDPPIKMGWIAAANPIGSAPCSAKNRETLNSLDFLMVSDQFMTETAMCADLFFPVTTYLEEEDLHASHWHNYLGPVNPVVPPRGEAKPDSWIFQQLAERLGFGDKIAGEPKFWLNKLMGKLEKSGITLEKLQQGPVKNPAAVQTAWMDGKFYTKSGKFEFVTSYGYQQEQAEGKYPYRLISPKTRSILNTQSLMKDLPEAPQVLLHPRLMEKLNVSDGEKVRVVSGEDAIEALVKTDDTQRNDVVFITPTIWQNDGGGVNRLRCDTMTNVGPTSAMLETTVRVEKL
jgi:anaerobic selenocysteine-containing dehydrogenase